MNVYDYYYCNIVDDVELDDMIVGDRVLNYDICVLSFG